MQQPIPWSEVLKLTRSARINDPMEAWDFKLLSKLVLSINALLTRVKTPGTTAADQAVRHVVYDVVRELLIQVGIDPDK